MNLRDSLQTPSGVYLLLEQWGVWSRYFGCRGYGNAGAYEDACIDDDTALQVDTIMADLKRTHYKVYKVLALYFIQKKDCTEILRELRCKRFRDDKKFNYDVVRLVVDHGVRLVRFRIEKLLDN